jgi:hypothetical protein
MKTIKTTKAILAAGLLFALAIHSFAIEGIKLSIQSSNVVLAWPSVAGETYMVQYRQTLDAADSWQTLADNYPALADTNQTTYVHSNQSGFFASVIGNSSGGSFATSAALRRSLPAVPLAMPANRSGAAIPVAIYPPGFDFSGYIILDPITGEQVNGADYVASSLSSLDAPQPLDGSYGNGGTYTTTATGYYRVVRDGAHLFGITNGMTLSGVVTIPVEVANGSGTLTSLGLTENGYPVYGVTSQAPPIPLPLQLTLNTTVMSNGVHQISASARWDDTNGGLWEVDSPPVTVNVYNEITFPNWMPRFGELGNSLMIAVQSAHADADWWIDIYDSQYVYIGTFSGHTDDGSIEGSWNLLGPDSEFHGDDTFHFVVTTEWTNSLAQQGAGAAAGGTATATAPPTWKVVDPWVGSGAWVAVAQHAFDSIQDCIFLYQELNAFVGAAQGVGWSVLPNPIVPGNPYPIGFQNDKEVGDWIKFREALYDSRSRNLIYLGHASPNRLGYSTNALISITAKEIADNLHTDPDNQTNRHAFRFVFLDGCSTSKGTLPEAFGVIHRPIADIGYYMGASIRPNTFVGWDADKNVGIWWGNLFYSHVNFIGWIQYDMLANSDGIKSAIAWAAGQPDVSWWLWTSELQVFGYTDLHFGQGNN